MTLKNLSMMAAVAATLTMSIASCTSDDEVNTEIVSGTQAALDQACADWKTARANWETSEAFLFGAADVYSIDPHTDTWPVDANTLGTLLRDNNFMNDIDNNIKTASVGVLGYHGIEYVLFREGKARNINQITNLEYKYVCAVAKDLYNATATLEATWDSEESNVERHNIAIKYISSHYGVNEEDEQTEELDGYTNFGKAFKNPGTGEWETALDATIEIISGCQDIIGEVGNSKIGLPYSHEDDSYIESPYAYNSITDFYDNIVSCKNSLYGSVGATAPNEKSLIYFCLNSGNNTLKSQAEEVQSKLDAALSKIQAMQYPFAIHYGDISCAEAIFALSELDDALDAMKTTLETYSGNSTVENQCKVINQNYVDNVVLVTYRTLADNAYKLYQSILKIQNN